MQSRLSAAELRAAADALVIALACAGDDAAFTEIVRRRHARVRRFMYRLCRRPALGDDLAQQVFLTVWRSLAAAALAGRVRRLAQADHDHDLARGAAPRQASSWRATSEEADFGSTAKRRPSASISTRRSRRCRRTSRLCVVLAYEEGLSHPEIAALTGMPIGTVKSHIFRGAAQMREVAGRIRRSLSHGSWRRSPRTTTIAHDRRLRALFEREPASFPEQPFVNELARRVADQRRRRATSTRFVTLAMAIGSRSPR